VLEGLGELTLERAPLLERLRSSGIPEERLTQLDAILRLQDRIPTVELHRLVEDAPEPAPRLHAGRHRASGAEALVLVSPWSDPAQLRRFLREVKALAALKHPLVASLLDVGENQSTCWVAVERVPGDSFAAALRRAEPPSETLALALTRRFAGALSALASVGLIHRHVTPDVLRFAAADGADARLVDSGLMRGLCGLRRQAPLDSPDYVAPEQVRGQPLDERTLVYNLGAILYHALLGAPAFVGSSPELVRKAHLYEDAPDLTCLLPDLHPATGRIVATAMRKVPGERYRGLDELAAACERALVALGAIAAPAAPAVEIGEPTPATTAAPIIADPFAALDAASGATAPVDQETVEITTRILAKHAALKAERSLMPPPRPRPVVTESFLSRSVPVARPDVVIGVIIANGWVDEQGQHKLREFFRANASSLALRMRGGVSALLATRGIITAEEARELELTLADQAPFPHYRVGRLLGAGRLGRTYVALDIAAAAEVAFKVFRVDSEELRERFRAEHASVGRLTHPGVAQSLAGGVDGEACFAASRLVRGESLASVLGEDRSAPESWALRVAQQAAEALAYVHARTGQAHLGLSLGTVRLQREERETRLFPPGERAVVTDFGLAALAPLRRGDPTGCAPELLRGEACDARADVFALGALLHRMLTGRWPALNEDADPGRLVPGLHPLTREAVIIALRPAPAERHADLDVLVAMLAQAAREVAEVYAHEPQLVRDEPQQPVSTRVLRRHLAAGPLGAPGVRPAGGDKPARERHLKGDPDFPQE
jgi:serine/threonine-protein kinase